MENANNNLPANILNMATALAQSAAQAGANAGMDAYMKFSKFGEWVYGAENIEVEPDSIWAVNPLGFQHGWTAWGTKEHGTDGQNVGEVMVPSTQPMPLEGNLPTVKGEWAKAVGVQMRCTSGEDEGVQVMFKSNSYGGRKAYAGLLQSVVARITAGKPDCMPLVKLTNDNYVHKTYGKIYTPVLEITGWANHADETPAPVSATVDRLPPQVEPPKVEEEPPRRRRRREV